jgi:hypothetical protein
MGGPVLVRTLELQHDIAGVVEFESFIGNRGAGDVAAQLLEFLALIHGTTYLGMEAESLYVGAPLQGWLGIPAGEGLQCQHVLLSINTSQLELIKPSLARHQRAD